MRHLIRGHLALVPVLFVAMISSACTNVIYTTTESGQRALHELTRLDGSIAAVPNGAGSQPDVSFDGTKVAFVQKDATDIRQVFVMTIGQLGTRQQITTDPVSKSYPRWSRLGHLAFASGSNIVVLDSTFANVDLGPNVPQTDGGLDFYDQGSTLVYERDDNLYVFAIGGSGSELQITSCPTPSAMCNFPIVSHDQTMLAYHQTVMLSPGWPEGIIVQNLSDPSQSSSITLGPALGGGGKIHSYDFSPRDDQMYVSAKAFDSATSTYGTELELFVVDLDGGNKEKLSPNPPVWYPSTYRWGL